jgi:hypothetical protein
MKTESKKKGGGGSMPRALVVTIRLFGYIGTNMINKGKGYEIIKNEIDEMVMKFYN